MDFSQQIEKIIRYQVNEEGIEESTVDFENQFTQKVTTFNYLPDYSSDIQNVLILSNKDLSLRYEADEFENNKEDNRPILFIFCYANEGFTENNIVIVEEEIRKIIEEDELSNEESNPKIKLFFITKNLEKAIRSNAFLTSSDIRNKVLGFMKKNIVKYSKRDISATYDYLELEQRIYNSQVGVLSRTRATISRMLNKPDTMGYVFSANLYDLVTLYNSKGKTLFAKNIRYGIADELDVDFAINETLANNPEEFWYLNNGITLIIEKNNLNLQNYEVISLSDPDEKGIELTVINGAQTLNSAAKFFYTQKDNNDAEKKAFVMLKIIEITNADLDYDEVNNRIDNITISLNRQKPIISDDIAFTLPAIKNINELREKYELEMVKQKNNIALFDGNELSDSTDYAVKNKQLTPSLAVEQIPTGNVEVDMITNNGIYLEPKENAQLETRGKTHTENQEYTHEDLTPYLFSIVRRGDISSTRNKRYTLKVLPRILFAIFLNQPGKARTGSNSSLIELNEERDHFKYAELFPTVQNDDEKFENIFLRNYKPVNFAMALYDAVDNYAKDKGVIGKIKSKNSHGESINKYGKYLVIYTIVKALKGDQETYEDWGFKDKDVKKYLDNNKYEKIIIELTLSWAKVLKEQDAGIWDSNAFKKNENIIKTYEDCKERIIDIIRGSA